MRLLASLVVLALLAGCSGTTDPSSNAPSGTGTGDGHDHTHDDDTTPTSGTATGTGGPVGATTTVRVIDSAFEDGTRTVAAGTTLRYQNAGQMGHTVTVHKAGEPTTQLKHDATIAAGAETSYTFTDAGTYHVWCRFHGTMTTGMASVVTVQ